MKMTLLLGNGFDINIGLKTKYSDFYRYYLSIQSPNSNISAWKSNISDNFDLWSDLEHHLQELAYTLNDNECQAFMEFLDDLTEELSNYLDTENGHFIFEDYANASEQFQKDIRNIESIIKKHIPLHAANTYKKQFVNRTIINFNYTSSIEKLLNINQNSALSSQSFTLIHPHGDLYTNLVIGVSSIAPSFQEDFGHQDVFREEMHTWLIKKNILTTMHELNLRYNQAKDSISSSDVICIYGMSIGESDSIWWSEIAEWMLQDSSHKLIIFSHSVSTKSTTRVPRKQYVNKGEPVKNQFIRNATIGLAQIDSHTDINALGTIRDNIVVLPTEGIFNVHAIDLPLTYT